MSGSRPLPALAAALLIAALIAAAAAAPEAAAAKAPRCKRIGLTVKLPSHDPTELRDSPSAIISAKRRARVFAPRIVLKRGKRVYARGRLSGRVARGRQTSVRLRMKRDPVAGRYRLRVRARRGGCGHAASRSRAWRMSKPSLPVRAAPLSTRTGDNVGSARFVLRPVDGSRVGPLKVAMYNAAGATVAEQWISALDGARAVAALPLASGLGPGWSTVRLTGREVGSGKWRSSAQRFRFAAGGGQALPTPETGVETQKVVVDWYDGNPSGRDLGGFVVPGIGYGQIVCRPDAQWIRIFPSDRGDEVSMMTWTYKDWHTYREKALREALHGPGTGPDFREGLNKFGPSEKRSTGEFQGIISDRGPIGGPGGGELAPPTTYDLTWVWDFRNPRRARCHVEATFETSTGLDQMPLARSLQLVWRGSGNAPGNSSRSIDFPGLGPVTVTCEPGAGDRLLSIASARGATVTTRQGSDDESAPQSRGPVIVRLPNNGMVVVEMDGGQRILVSSRYKVNDPSAAGNRCAVAAQILSG